MTLLRFQEIAARGRVSAAALFLGVVVTLAPFVAGAGDAAGNGEGSGPDWPVGEGSRFMGEFRPVEASPLAIERPEEVILVIYLPGSAQEPVADSCKTHRPGINIPFAATRLAGSRVDGYPITVYAYCTPSRVGGFNQPDGDGETKVVKRTKDLEGLLALAGERGFRPERTFVMGQSAGGWAGLLAMRRGNANFAGVITTSPAFAGWHGKRLRAWQEERDRQAEYISEAERLPALVFSFEGDIFEPASALGFLKRRDDVRFHQLPNDRIEGVECTHGYPHTLIFDDCFGETQRDTILDFIRMRVRDGEHAPG